MDTDAMKNSSGFEEIMSLSAEEKAELLKNWKERGEK